MKTLLILADGMRPDSIQDLAFTEKLRKTASYSMKAASVMPSVTLPCHMSIFHSVDPIRHGITTNTYMPQVRPINGLCEVLKTRNLKCSFFYDWEQLRDLARPGSMYIHEFRAGRVDGWENTMEYTYSKVLEHLTSDKASDFTFWYIGLTDETGHAHGWMGEEYMNAVRKAMGKIESLISQLSDEFNVIITADHGGHDRTHGTEMAEDMTVPMFFLGSAFEAGKELENVSIKDIAPTIAKLHGIPSDDDWEGASVI